MSVESDMIVQAIMELKDSLTQDIENNLEDSIAKELFIRSVTDLTDEKDFEIIAHNCLEKASIFMKARKEFLQAESEDEDD